MVEATHSGWPRWERMVRPARETGGAARERDDGNAHVQRVEGRRSAGVGKRVEGDVDAVVEFQVVMRGEVAHEFQAVGVDAFGRKLREDGAVVGGGERVKDQPRVGNVSQEPGPRMTGLRGYLGEVVEAAEGDVALRGGGRRDGLGGVMRELVTPIRPETERFFHERRFPVGRGIKVRVGKPVVDGFVAGGTAIGEVRDGQGRGLAAEHQHAVVFRVNGKVDEDVDLVGADQVGQLFVGKVGGVAPDVGVLAEHSGKGGRAPDVAVAMDREAGVVVVSQQRKEEQPDRVVAEVGGDIADLQRAVGVGGVGVGAARGAQGNDECLIPLAVLGGNFFRAEVGVEVDGVEEVRGGLRVPWLGPAGKGLAVVFDRFVHAAELAQGVGQVVVGGGEVGLDGQSPPVDFHGLFGAVGNAFEQGAKVVQDNRIGGVVGEGGLVGLGGFMQPVLVAEGVGEVVVGLGKIRAEGNGPAECRDGALGLAQSGQHVAEGVERIGVARIGLGRGLEVTQCAGQVAPGAEGGGEVVVGFGETRIEFERAGCGLGGLVRLARVEQEAGEVVKALGVAGVERE